MRSSVLNHGSVWASFGPWAAARAPTTLHTRRALLLLLLVLLSHPMGTAAHLADTQQIAAEVLTRLHRCSGTRSTYCVDYFTQPYVWLKPPPVLNRPCPNNCSHLGVCHGDTGRCDCPAGARAVPPPVVLAVVQCWHGLTPARPCWHPHLHGCARQAWAGSTVGRPTRARAPTGTELIAPSAHPPATSAPTSATSTGRRRAAPTAGALRLLPRARMHGLAVHANVLS